MSGYKPRGFVDKKRDEDYIDRRVARAERKYEEINKLLNDLIRLGWISIPFTMNEVRYSRMPHGLDDIRKSVEKELGYQKEDPSGQTC